MNRFTSFFKKKKGSAMVEFIFVLPLFIMVAWLFTNFILYVIAINTSYTAANQASKEVATYMRGKLSTDAVPNNATLSNNIRRSIKNSINHNGLIELNNTIDTASVTYASGMNSCDSLAYNTICVAYDNNQFKLVFKTHFLIAGLDNLLGVNPTFDIISKGVSQRELSNRFNYN